MYFFSICIAKLFSSWDHSKMVEVSFRHIVMWHQSNVNFDANSFWFTKIKTNLLTEGIVLNWNFWKNTNYGVTNFLEKKIFRQKSNHAIASVNNWNSRFFHCEKWQQVARFKNNGKYEIFDMSQLDITSIIFPNIVRIEAGMFQIYIAITWITNNLYLL